MADDDNFVSAPQISAPEVSAPERRHSRVDYDNDYDLRPGNSSSSGAYQRRYNFQREDEYSNLPDDDDQLRGTTTRMAEDNALAEAQMLAQLSERIKFKANAGRFVAPKKGEDTYAAHLQLVRQGDKVDIHFDPSVYQFFDAIIAANADRPELFDPNHADYEKHAMLRDNLAVLRNVLMNQYYLGDDGKYTEEDERFLPNLAEIAADVGNALHNEKGARRIIAHSLNADLLNIEGEGAARAYEFLRERQSGNDILSKLGVVLRHLFNQPWRNWDLPPREETALSKAGLTAPAPVDELCHCTPQQLSACRMHAMASQAKQPHPVAAVDNAIKREQKREVVYHGHIILDWLRNLKFTDKPMEELIDSGTPAEREETQSNIRKVLDYYKNYLKTALEDKPELANDAKIQAANEVAEALEHSLELLAKLEKPHSLAATMQISSDVTQQPERWNELKGHTVDRLMETLKGGLEQAVSAMEQQQEDIERQSEEAAEQATLDSMMHNNKRRKKKKRSSTTAAKQRRQNLDLIADDRAAGQGIYAPRGEDRIILRERREGIMNGIPPETQPLTRKEKTEAAWKGLPPEAEALTKAVGQTLKGMQQKGSAMLTANNTLAQTAITVSAGDAVSPDDQPLAVRHAQQREREQQNGKQI